MKCFQVTQKQKPISSSMRLTVATNSASRDKEDSKIEKDFKSLLRQQRNGTVKSEKSNPSLDYHCSVRLTSLGTKYDLRKQTDNFAMSKNSSLSSGSQCYVQPTKLGTKHIPEKQSVHTVIPRQTSPSFGHKCSVHPTRLKTENGLQNQSGDISVSKKSGPSLGSVSSTVNSTRVMIERGPVKQSGHTTMSKQSRLSSANQNSVPPAKKLKMERDVPEKESSNPAIPKKSKSKPGAGFQCSQCPLKLRTKHGLEKHEFCHTGEKPHVCNSCGAKFAVLEYLKNHMKGHSEERSYICETCGKSFARKTTLNAHRNTHSEDSVFECSECEQKFTTKANLDYHKKTHHQQRAHECDACDKKFISASTLRSHMKIHSDNKEFKCEQCGKQYTNKTLYNEHMARHKGSKAFPCEICPKRFYSQRELKAHTFFHEQETDFKCFECQMFFLSSNSLRIHTSKIHFSYKHCEFCDEQFLNARVLKRHIFGCHRELCVASPKPKVPKELTTMYQKESCDKCGKMLSNRYRLRVHLAKQHHLTKQEIKEFESVHKSYNTAHLRVKQELYMVMKGEQKGSGCKKSNFNHAADSIAAPVDASVEETEEVKVAIDTINNSEAIHHMGEGYETMPVAENTIAENTFTATMLDEAVGATVESLDGMQETYDGCQTEPQALSGKHRMHLAETEALSGKHRMHLAETEALSGNHCMHLSETEALSGKHRMHLAETEALSGKHRMHLAEVNTAVVDIANDQHEASEEADMHRFGLVDSLADSTDAIAEPIKTADIQGVTKIHDNNQEMDADDEEHIIVFVHEDDESFIKSNSNFKILNDGTAGSEGARYYTEDGDQILIITDEQEGDEHEGDMTTGNNENENTITEHNSDKTLYSKHTALLNNNEQGVSVDKAYPKADTTADFQKFEEALKQKIESLKECSGYENFLNRMITNLQLAKLKHRQNNSD